MFWEIVHIKCDPYYISNFIYFISIIFRRDVTGNIIDSNALFRSTMERGQVRAACAKCA